MRRPAAVLSVTAVIAGLLAGCARGEPQDELMVTDNPVAATPARSPAATATPAGLVLPFDRPVTALAVDRRSAELAVAAADPPELLFYPIADPSAGPRRTVPLPGPADALQVADGELVAVVGSASALVRLTLPDGAPDITSVTGTPTGVADADGRTLVAVRDRREVLVRAAGQPDRTITGGLFSADQVVDTGRGALVLDRLRTAVFELDLDAGTVGTGLRAGSGAANAVADRYGRVLVTDTRGGALLAFSLDPLLLRQQYPVPGAPYGIAYDRDRDLVWVTLTATNEVVGYQIAGEEPQERHRFPTVSQPNTVSVDPSSGRVVVASATGEGIQVISDVE